MTYNVLGLKDSNPYCAVGDRITARKFNKNKNGKVQKKACNH